MRHEKVVCAIDKVRLNGDPNDPNDAASSHRKLELTNGGRMLGCDGAATQPALMHLFLQFSAYFSRLYFKNQFLAIA